MKTWWCCKKKLRVIPGLPFGDAFSPSTTPHSHLIFDMMTTKSQEQAD
jgi:hypothetical protein